jgi:hypothetical protein
LRYFVIHPIFEYKRTHFLQVRMHEICSFKSFSFYRFVFFKIFFLFIYTCFSVQELLRKNNKTTLYYKVIPTDAKGTVDHIFRAIERGSIFSSMYPVESRRQYPKKKIIIIQKFVKRKRCVYACVCLQYLKEGMKKIPILANLTKSEHAISFSWHCTEGLYSLQCTPCNYDVSKYLFWLHCTKQILQCLFENIERFDVFKS